jgi:predicted metal-dependent HD superfamily phosphohydrolase
VFRAPYTLPAPVDAALTAAYSEPHRAYHTTLHLADLMRWFDIVAKGPGWEHPEDVYTAILFHDAVYDPTAKDNETKSAAWARTAIADFGLPVNADRVVAMIELTAKHGTLESATGDAALFLDADMSILGTDSVRYRSYANEVRREYAMVPAPAYRAGRGAFLASVLAKPRIYFTAFFHDQLDAQARTNLADEQVLLASGALDAVAR